MKILMLLVVALPGWIALPVLRRDGTRAEAQFIITEDGRVFADVKPRP